MPDAQFDARDANKQQASVSHSHKAVCLTAYARAVDLHEVNVQMGGHVEFDKTACPYMSSTSSTRHEAV